MSRASEISPCHTQSQRGSILLIVLITMALLSLLVVTLISMRMTADFSVLAAIKLAQQEYTATGGMEIARVLLKQDKANSENDNLFEAWALPQRCKIGGYDCEIVIIDEDSKINMAQLASEDADSITRMARLLTIVVQGLKIEVAEKKVAEACKLMAEDLKRNAISVNSFERLVAYLPFTEEIVYGYKDESGKIISAGLVNYITFQSVTRININTAPREVLLAILGFENEELANSIIEFRESEDADGNRYGFTNFKELKKTDEGREQDYGEDNILFHQDSIALITKHFDINSHIFMITAVSPTGTIGENENGTAAALPARGWVWTIERTTTGEINTIALLATTQPAKYLESKQ